MRVSAALNQPAFTAAGFPDRSRIFNLQNAIDDLVERVVGHEMTVGHADAAAAEAELLRLTQEANAMRSVLRQLRIDLEGDGYRYTPVNVVFRVIGNQDGSNPPIQERPRGVVVRMASSTPSTSKTASKFGSVGGRSVGQTMPTPRRLMPHMTSPSPGPRAASEATHLRSMLDAANDTIFRLRNENSQLITERNNYQSRLEVAENAHSTTRIRGEIHVQRMRIGELERHNGEVSRVFSSSFVASTNMSS